MFNRRAIRRQPTPQTTIPTNFTFNFDDEESHVESSPATHHVKTIDDVLAQSSIPSSISSIVVKSNQHEGAISHRPVRVPPALAHANVPLTITSTQKPSHSLAVTASPALASEPLVRHVIAFPPRCLSSLPTICPNHFIPRLNPGVFVIFAPKMPTVKKRVVSATRPVAKGTKAGAAAAAARNISAKKKKAAATKTTATPAKTTTQPVEETKSSLESPEESTQNILTSNITSFPSSLSQDTMAQPNLVPSWVIALDPLDEDDFDDELPDIMIDPESYLLSIPNPTSQPRNIFISVTAPLRCISKDGVLLESSYGLRKFRPDVDNFLVHDQQTSANNIDKIPKSQNKKASANRQQISPHRFESQRLCPQLTHSNNSTVAPSVAVDPPCVEDQPVFHESTTFAMVIPPRSICDLCYLVTSEFELQFPKQRLDAASISKFVTSRCFDESSQLFALMMRPLSTPARLIDHGISSDHMPLNIAGRYIFNHIGTFPTNKPVSTPLFIPIFASPLPPTASFLISQSAHGAMTHNMPQTCHAIDFAMMSGTPIYSPCDGVVKDCRATSCSVGNHALNLFDWNGITLETSLTHIIIPFSEQQSTYSPEPTSTTGEPTATPAVAVSHPPVMFHPTVLSPSVDSSVSFVPPSLSPELTQQLSSHVYIDLVHLDKILVQPGQTVKAGDLIAYSGAAGFAPCPHLHMQVTLSNAVSSPSIPFTLCPVETYRQNPLPSASTLSSLTPTTSPPTPTLINALPSFPSLNSGYALNGSCQLISPTAHAEHVAAKTESFALQHDIPLKTTYKPVLPGSSLPIVDPTVPTVPVPTHPLPTNSSKVPAPLSSASAHPSHLQVAHPDIPLFSFFFKQDGNPHQPFIQFETVFGPSHSASQ